MRPVINLKVCFIMLPISVMVLNSLQTEALWQVMKTLLSFDGLSGICTILSKKIYWLSIGYNPSSINPFQPWSYLPLYSYIFLLHSSEKVDILQSRRPVFISAVITVQLGDVLLPSVFNFVLFKQHLFVFITETSGTRLNRRLAIRPVSCSTFLYRIDRMNFLQRFDFFASFLVPWWFRFFETRFYSSVILAWYYISNFFVRQIKYFFCHPILFHSYYSSDTSTTDLFSLYKTPPVSAFHSLVLLSDCWPILNIDLFLSIVIQQN